MRFCVRFLLPVSLLLGATCLGQEVGIFQVADFEFQRVGMPPWGWRASGPKQCELGIVEDAEAGSRALEFSFPACEQGEWAIARLAFGLRLWKEAKALHLKVRGRGEGTTQYLELTEADRDRWVYVLPLDSDEWKQLDLRIDEATFRRFRKFGDGKLHGDDVTSIAFMVEGENAAHLFRVDDITVSGTAVEVEAPPDKYSTFRKLMGDYRDPSFAKLYEDFVRLDPATRHCVNADGPFFVLSPVYVHADPMNVGFNPGEFLGIISSAGRQINPKHLDEDCAHARTLGFNTFNIRFLPKAVIHNGKWLPTWDGKDAWEVYDKILDAVQRNGMYTVMPIWGTKEQPLGTIPKGQAFLDPECWREYCKDIGDAVRYYSKRTVILGWQVGLETASIPLLDRSRPPKRVEIPEVRAEFQKYLRRQYGGIEALKRAWGGGYVETPDGFEYREDAFAAYRDFSDVHVPLFAFLRQNDLQLDPVMVDFNYFREDYYIRRINELIDVIGANDPNHLILFDYAGEHPSWSYIWSGRRGAEIRTDIMTHGQGYQDRRFHRHRNPLYAALSEGVPDYFMSTMEYCRAIAYNAPKMLEADGGCPKAIGSGEFGYACFYEGEKRIGECAPGKPGAAMLDGEEEEQLRWMSSLFLDYLGAGSAYARVYDYGVMRQPRVIGGTPADHLICDWFKGITTTLRRQRALFALENANVAILRNKTTYFANFDYMDTDNVYNLGSILYQLHIPFDVLTEDQLTLAPARFKMSLNDYKFIFIPHQRQLFLPETWKTLRRWLEEEPGRGLCMGLYENLDRYLNPAEPCADMVWAMGCEGYEAMERIIGDQALILAQPFAALRAGSKLRVNFTTPGAGRLYRDDMLCPVGFFPERGRTQARIDSRPVMIAHKLSNGNMVYSCGFPLGFTYYGKHNELNDPDAMNPVYGRMLEGAGVEPAFMAPANLGVWVSTNRNIVLIKKRGEWDSGPIILPKVGRAVYTKAKTVLREGGAHLEMDLPEGHHATWVERMADVEEGEDVAACEGTIEGTLIDKLQFRISGRGKCRLILNLWPDSEYDVSIAGRRQRVRIDDEGRTSLTVTLDGEIEVSAHRR